MAEPPATHPPNPSEQLDAVVAKLSSEKDADIFLYSAGMMDAPCGRLISLIRSIPNKRTNAILALTTNGGSADSAYQLARTIKHHYAAFHLLIFGYCKSAGTLVAVAADEIVMSEFGQFGPLDVQFADKTEMFGQTAALDVNQALTTISESAFNFFVDHFFKLGPGRGVPTDKAVEMAKVLTLAVIEPIAAQIDPLLLGRVDRSMKIAEEYCSRLNPAFTNIKRLVGGYPSHEFVIDLGEAKQLFKTVRTPTKDEIEVENLLRYFNCVPLQDARETILCLSKNKVIAENIAEDDLSKSNDAEPSNGTAPGDGAKARSAGAPAAQAEQKPARGGHSRAPAKF